MPDKRESGLQLAWTTISYRTILMMLSAVLLAILIVLYFVFPERSHSILAKAENLVSGVVNRFAGSHGSDGNSSGEAQQARFTSFDGTVRVKKVNSNTWVPADYSLPLEKGDVVQTESEGIAKITFADGSTYSMQPDSLITIEENGTDANQQFRAQVNLQSGNLELYTGDQPTTEQVKIDNTTTTVGKGSALQAANTRNGPPGVLLQRGQATFQINNEPAQKISANERVTFNPDTGEVSKKREVAPPDLVAPENMKPIFVSGKTNSLDFSWTPVETVKEYHVQLSKNPYFTSLVKDDKVPSSFWKVADLPEGKYYWRVLSMDVDGKESIPSVTNAFTIVNKGNENVSMPLEEQLSQQGHVIEIVGKTEPNARVMVNGEPVPVINPDGSFTYFTPPLPTGESVVTITAQNKAGGVATKTEKVVIQ